MTQRIVVLGTGTGVGKTWLTAAVATAARAAGQHPLALKPIESGVSSEAVTDAARIAHAAGHEAIPHCYALPDPVTPWLAAERAGIALDLANIFPWSNQAEKKHHTTPHVLHITLIESAGGVFSPLTQRADNLDLAASYPEARWLLVACNRLGVLHDVRATLEAMRARARYPDLLALVAARDRDESTGSNAELLRRLGMPCPVLELGWNDLAGARAVLDRLTHPR